MLRAASGDLYTPFDEWFRKKALQGTKAWTYSEDAQNLGAVCVYDIQHDQKITDDGQVLVGKALKLCTFKVGESVRGREIGEPMNLVESFALAGKMSSKSTAEAKKRIKAREQGRKGGKPEADAEPF